MATRFELALPLIRDYFRQQQTPVFSHTALVGILDENRIRWRLPKAFSISTLLESLLDEGVLRRIVLRSKAHSALKRYACGQITIYDVALCLKRGSYLSHGTAVYLHGLRTEDFSSLYVNHEQTPKSSSGELSQEAINRAFSRPARVSNYIFLYRGREIVVINGKHTNRLGVESTKGGDQSSVPATNIERTLIDIAVRPVYAGGPALVLKAYEAAKDRVSPKALLEMLETLAYVYPYRQAVGFYMERAGYDESQLALLERFPKQFDFYLGNKTADLYSTRWRIFYPKGL